MKIEFFSFLATFRVKSASTQLATIPKRLQLRALSGTEASPKSTSSPLDYRSMSMSMSIPLPSVVAAAYNEDDEEDDGPEGIIGGNKLQRGDRPYLVSLGIDYPENEGGYSHFCGATLIAPSVVLTAAHCLTDNSGFSLFDIRTIINVNKFYMDDNTDVQSFPLCENEFGDRCDTENVAYAIVHPEYDSNSVDNDFALMFLPEDIDDIEPVALNSDPDFLTDGEELEAFGWGDTDPDPEKVGASNVPYTVTVDYVPNDQCAQDPNLYLPERITSNMLCAADEGKDTCQGDSSMCIL